MKFKIQKSEDHLKAFYDARVTDLCNILDQAQHVSILGAPWSGKSSIAKLVADYYDRT
mgnify:CR=1 FL=1